MLPNDGKAGLGDLLRKGRKEAVNPIQGAIQGGIYHAITVSAADPEGRGRIAAYIPKLGGDPNHPMFFKYASPFGGTNGTNNYGFFAVPPDPGLTILVMFVDNGTLTEGYWFAVAQQIPDVSSGGYRGPAVPDGTGQGEGAFVDVPAAKSDKTTLYESQNAIPRDRQGEGGMVDTPAGQKFASQGTNSDRNANLAEQGTYSDLVRGNSASSPQRDASYNEPQPSKVYGMNTPGQNAITFDDGSVGDDGTIYPSQIRLTTGNGASVILDGSNDFIYMVNSSGSAWVEIGSEGNIMMYAQGSISMRAEKDFNLRADQNINIESGKNIVMKSGSRFLVNSGADFHLKSVIGQYFDSGTQTHMKAGGNMYVSTSGILHLNGPSASPAKKLEGQSMPDIQGSQSTKVNDSIVSSMPSHEPFLRPSPANSGGGDVVPDPSSYDAQSEAVNSELDAAAAAAGEVIQQGAGGGTVKYGNIGTRTIKLQPQMESILKTAASQTKLDVVITSAGQPSSGSNRVGSHRHDNGFAADVSLFNGRGPLSISNTSDIPLIKSFFQAAKNAGAISIGGGPGYMGGTAFHIDIAPGNSVPSNSGKVWGAGGTYASAPSWLKSLMG